MQITYDEAQPQSNAAVPANPDITRIEPPANSAASRTNTKTGFFDAEHPERDLSRIELERFLNPMGKELYLLKTHLSYQDTEFGVIIVPAREVESMETDFASIPQVFTWLIPKSGKLLAAALIHDGLTPPSAQTYTGPPVTQRDADRILRDAMRDLGTGWIQRWLVWTSVAIATEGKEAAHAWKSLPGALRLLRLFVLIGGILLLGTMATLDLLGVADLLPWMGNDSVAYEILTGALFAIVVPVVLSLLFIPGRLTSAALILGIAIAVFLHATLLLVVLFAFYNGLEEAINAGAHRGSWRKAASWFCGLGALLIGLPGAGEVGALVAAGTRVVVGDPGLAIARPEDRGFRRMAMGTALVVLDRSVRGVGRRLSEVTREVTRRIGRDWHWLWRCQFARSTSGSPSGWGAASLFSVKVILR